MRKKHKNNKYGCSSRRILTLFINNNNFKKILYFNNDNVLCTSLF